MSKVIISLDTLSGFLLSATAYVEKTEMWPKTSVGRHYIRGKLTIVLVAVLSAGYLAGKVFSSLG